MKILYHHRIASKDGQYVHIEEINKSLLKQGHEIVLVAPRMGEQQDFGGDGGLVSKLKAKLPGWLYEIMEITYAFWAFFKLAKAIKAHKPDFIYERYNLFTPAGIWAKKVFGIPLLLEINAPLLEERSKYNGISLKGLARWSESYTWRNADAVLPVTDVLADYQRAVGIPEARIHVIPNGINTDAFMSGLPASPLKTDVSDKTVIGFVGFVREWHGLDKIVDLIAKPGNEHLFLLVVGDGPAIPAVKEQAKTLGVEARIHITGLVKRDDMPAWLVPIDIALQPAVVAYASPLKMLEYMACEKAIVAPDQPNIRELLEHDKNALLFDPSDNQALIDACAQLAADKGLQDRLRSAAKGSVVDRNLTWDGNAETIIKIAQALIEKARD